MITVKQVTTRKERKEFTDFPLKLYEGNDCFVPPLYGDEMKIFGAKNGYNDTCESSFFLARDDSGKVVGRISGIIQRAANEKNGEKRARFTRFDCIDDPEVAAALFRALEDWALSKGMDTVCGPLGYSDLEREGLLVEGFDQLSTFEEQYNAEYYGRFIEQLGYRKEVDWTESRLYLPDEEEAKKVEEMADFVMNRYNLHVGPAKNVNDFIKKYADPFFELIDVAYDGLYGTVPFTDNMKKMIITNFKLIIDLDHVLVLLNEKDELVCLALCFPSIARAVQPSKGKLTPAALVRLLKAIKKPNPIDLGLVAVRPDYLSKGIPAVMCGAIIKMLREDGVEYAETNLNLEDNYAITNLWKRFRTVQHKRRRSYVKKLADNNSEEN
jgi:GNAT superfamily N-acetyltransferase